MEDFCRDLSGSRVLERLILLVLLSYLLNAMSVNRNKKLFWSFEYRGPLVCKILLAQAIDTLGDTCYLITRSCKEDDFCTNVFFKIKESKDGIRKLPPSLISIWTSNGMVHASNILNVPRKPSPSMFEIVRTNGDYRMNIAKLPFLCKEHRLQFSSDCVFDNTLLPSTGLPPLDCSCASIPHEICSNNLITQLVEEKIHGVSSLSL